MGDHTVPEEGAPAVFGMIVELVGDHNVPRLYLFLHAADSAG
jgi:hypothetical protein